VSATVPAARMGNTDNTVIGSEARLRSATDNKVIPRYAELQTLGKSRRTFRFASGEIDP
jgi:hypothetical protein